MLKKIYKKITGLNLDRSKFESNFYDFDWQWAVEIKNIKINFYGCGFDGTIYAVKK